MASYENLLSVFALLFLGMALPISNARCDYPAIFNFGDSDSDTGTIHLAFPGSELAELYPYGRTFFGKPTGRYSDGRLGIDFLAAALGYPFLNPYFERVDYDFSHGVNFAAAGAIATPSMPNFIAPVSLAVQLSQFQLFKKEVLRKINIGGPVNNLPSAEAFSNGLYTLQIGGNDFSYGYMKLNMTPFDVENKIVPAIVKAVTDAVQMLYNEGARNIMVSDVGPQGCQPFWLSLGNLPPSDFDKMGCSISFNSPVRTYDRLLKQQIQALRATLKDANLIYVDTYRIIQSLFKSPKRHGFRHTTTACCGAGGKYNYTYNAQCGSSGPVDGKVVFVDSCLDPSKYIVWDGVHWTDAANKVIVQQILSNRFFDPPTFKMSDHCDFTAP